MTMALDRVDPRLSEGMEPRPRRTAALHGFVPEGEKVPDPRRPHA